MLTPTSDSLGLTEPLGTERPSGDHHPLLSAISRIVDDAVRPLTDEIARLRSRNDALTALGPDRLIPYGDFLRANHISYELGQKLRDAGQLKVLRVGGKLMVRRGHAAEFVRNLPLD